MMQRIGIAIGAGLAAALLFAVTTKGTALALLLASLAPLPIVIATLGWGIDMGALAVLVAGVVAFVIIDPLLAVAQFAAAIALPAWALSFLSLLPRERLFQRGAQNDGAAWFPVGGIVACAALIGGFFGAVSLVSMALAYGGYGKGVDALVAESSPNFKEALDGVTALPTGMSIEDFASIAVRLTPAILAVLIYLMLCANLYLGARAVRLSQRLKRPWPNLPEALVLPQFLSAGLIACIGLSLALHGAPAHLAWIGVGVLGCAYVTQGLAVVHSLTRGLPARTPMLVAIYLASMVTAPLSVPALMIVGLVEGLLSLRARRAAAANVKS
jgi:hypothetical protein